MSSLSLGTWSLDSDEKVDVYYFEIGRPQQPPQETEFQTLHNSILVTNEAWRHTDGARVTILSSTTVTEHCSHSSNPEWNVYRFTPYCGTSCIPFIYGCTDDTAQNYDDEANTEDGSCYYNAGCTQAGYVEYYNQGYEADLTTAAVKRSLCSGAWTPKPLTTIQKPT